MNSPQLLELSGVGDGQRLSGLGLPVVADRPGVGEGLQDHYNVPMLYRLGRSAGSLNGLASRSGRVRAALRYLLGGGGPLATGVGYATAFARTHPELDRPDVKFVIMPLCMALKALPDGRHSFVVDDKPGLTLIPAQIRPTSRGSVHIRSNDPRAAPLIAPNYLESPADQEAVVAALRLGRDVASRPTLAPLIEHPLMPDETVRSDHDLLDFARRTGTSGFHGAGTCAMGVGPEAVVDPQLRVLGVEGLRVVDASIMPRLVSGNTNAPTIMIAERAADLIRGRQAASACEGAGPGAPHRLASEYA